MDRLTDFFFIGSGILPAILTFNGEPGLGIMAAVFLSIAGGICAIGDWSSPVHRPIRPRR